MNTLTYTLIAYRPDGATNKSGHDIFVSRDWQEVVRRTAILLDQNARCETDQPWNYYLLVDGQFAGPYTGERLVRAATNYPRPVRA
ncbi:hypothetical protein ACI2S5_06210 [Ralstonia nicotianae]|uniref:Uncharacterized protein n=2 Tax=Ralstonia solanacearum species complex TaxID=3116862 RepID=A0A0S4UF63_RALSL|nr:MULTISPECIES: hypothetical protein [Ralstonia]ARS59105.1 hypothetical protein BC427_23710 [Ralstonia solanacearum FJAT-91]AUS42425.1 hypothetical protein CYD94_09690 [Ralstonia solanacearum]API77433.1 hypothetical protein AC251_23010 [Ralstonia pseudosolanacearum]AST86580.1 hypothetical protein CIG66_08985 [Ralstonia pseudosolanacearum]AXW16998.1 hypothetical protein CJO84_20965 [Ralstonia solanacearum]